MSLEAGGGLPPGENIYLIEALHKIIRSSEAERCLIYAAIDAAGDAVEALEMLKAEQSAPLN